MGPTLTGISSIFAKLNYENWSHVEKIMVRIGLENISKSIMMLIETVQTGIHR